MAPTIEIILKEKLLKNKLQVEESSKCLAREEGRKI
jgi:hypothetical protein